MCVLGRYTLTRFTRHHQTASLISRLQETHKTEGWHEDSQTCTNQLKTRETHFSRETGTKEHIYYWILAVMQGGTMRNNSASAYHFPYIYIYAKTRQQTSADVHAFYKPTSTTSFWPCWNLHRLCNRVRVTNSVYRLPLQPKTLCQSRREPLPVPGNPK